MNTTTTLEQKISAALTNTTRSAADLLRLLIELDQGIVAQTEAAKRLSEAALDPLACPDGPTARASAEDATFAANGLRTLQSRLQQRYQQVAERERIDAWLRELKDLKLKQQPLISAFAAAYQNLIDASILFGKMERMDAEIQRHHATRPAGVARSSTA